MQVGNRYEVRLVRAVWKDKLKWWPILGGCHNDPELNFLPDHWHVDFRFFNHQEMKHIQKSAEQNNWGNETPWDRLKHEIYATPVMLRLIEPLNKTKKLFSLTYGWRTTTEDQNKQIREYLEKNHTRKDWTRKSIRPMLRYFPIIDNHYKLSGRLYETHKDSRIDINSPVCPHRGADLNGVPVVDGTITCPLHGIIFCAKTGESLWTEQHIARSHEPIYPCSL